MSPYLFCVDCHICFNYGSTFEQYKLTQSALEIDVFRFQVFKKQKQKQKLVLKHINYVTLIITFLN